MWLLRMKSIIFLICMLLTEFALADPETTESNEKPESVAPTNTDELAKEKEPATETNTVTDGVFVSTVDIKTLEDNKTVDDSKNLEETNKSESTTAGSSGEENSGKLLKKEPGEETTTVGSKEELADNSVKKPAGSNLLDAVNKVAADVTTPGSSNEETTDKTIGLKKVDAADQPANEGTTTAVISGSGEENVNTSPKKDIESDKLGDATNVPDISPQASGEESSGKSEKKTSAPQTLDSPNLTPQVELKSPAMQLNKVDSPSLKIVNSTDIDTKPKELPKTLGLGDIEEIAAHEMTPTEQKAYVCSLGSINLCEMVIDLTDNKSITDPGANAVCKGLAATMGYKGACVALMKTDPITMEPIFTRACSYYKTLRSKCLTNFITSQPQTNLSQVAYNCSNGLSNYIPTSCVNRHKQLVLD